MNKTEEKLRRATLQLEAYAWHAHQLPPPNAKTGVRSVLDHENAREYWQQMYNVALDATLTLVRMEVLEGKTPYVLTWRYGEYGKEDFFSGNVFISEGGEPDFIAALKSQLQRRLKSDYRAIFFRFDLWVIPDDLLSMPFRAILQRLDYEYQKRKAVVMGETQAQEPKFRLVRFDDLIILIRDKPTPQCRVFMLPNEGIVYNFHPLAERNAEDSLIAMGAVLLEPTPEQLSNYLLRALIALE